MELTELASPWCFDPQQPDVVEEYRQLLARHGVS